TEQPTTTESSTEDVLSQQAENVEAPPKKENLEKLEEPQQGQFYVVLPQGQNVIYTVPRSAALVAVPKGELLTATPTRLQAVPFSSAVASAMYTPFSASYIQIYQ